VSGETKLGHSWRFEIPFSSGSVFFQNFPQMSSSFFHSSCPCTSWGEPAVSRTMKITRKCRACGSLFAVEQRNANRHFHCPAVACQKSRRALAQQRRRQAQPARPGVKGARRLQAGPKPPEATILQEHPMFMGLLSMLTGSSDLQQLKIMAGRLAERGRDILGLLPQKGLDSKTL